jgi:glycosyltransferase involved in cell wall biosynthesis
MTSDGLSAALDLDGVHPRVAAVVWAVEDPVAWIDTVRSLLAIKTISKVHVHLFHGAKPAKQVLSDPRVHITESIYFERSADAALADGYDQILFVVDPVQLPAATLDYAVDWMAEDPRIGTISFLSNAAGYLSFPYRNTEVPTPIDGMDHTSVTARLRECSEPVGPTPIAVPEGAAILVSRSALVTTSGLEPWHDGSAFLSLVEFGLRGAARGFNNFLDANTYVRRLLRSGAPRQSVLAFEDVRHRLHRLHGSFPGLHDLQSAQLRGLLAETLDLARAKVEGLRLLIDGSALGPQEMGTQVLLVALTTAIAARPEIRSIALCVPNPEQLPAYARPLALIPKVTVYRAGELDFPGAPHVDIIHRPYQPDKPIPWERWRDLGKRSVITVQDLIAFRNGSYFRDWPSWEFYRENFRQQVSQTDAVFSISHDVVRAIVEERMPIPRSAIYVVENGMDFHSHDADVSTPHDVAKRNWTSDRFLLIVGADYTHKNRDLGLRIWKQLKARGHDLRMILAGATVPYGSSRMEESRVVGLNTDDLLVLPSVTSAERNWLLKHCALLLYPTSAEGFGFMPFEAGIFGRPSLYVSFGPLRELSADGATPRAFDLDALVDRAERLLADQGAARQSVSDTMRNADVYSWSETARKAVAAYFDILARPGRAP